MLARTTAIMLYLASTKAPVQWRIEVKNLLQNQYHTFKALKGSMTKEMRRLSQQISPLTTWKGGNSPPISVDSYKILIMGPSIRTWGSGWTCAKKRNMISRKSLRYTQLKLRKRMSISLNMTIFQKILRFWNRNMHYWLKKWGSISIQECVQVQMNLTKLLKNWVPPNLKLTILQFQPIWIKTSLLPPLRAIERNC